MFHGNVKIDVKSFYFIFYISSRFIKLKKRMGVTKNNTSRVVSSNSGDKKQDAKELVDKNIIETPDFISRYGQANDVLSTCRGAISLMALWGTWINGILCPFWLFFL